jgi:hypothetical protein
VNGRVTGLACGIKSWRGRVPSSGELSPPRPSPNASPQSARTLEAYVGHGGCQIDGGGRRRRTNQEGPRSSELAEHFGEQFHRQADYVRLAPLEHVHPAEAILIAEPAGLPFPLPAFDIGGQIRRREAIHF